MKREILICMACSMAEQMYVYLSTLLVHCIEQSQQFVQVTSLNSLGMPA